MPRMIVFDTETTGFDPNRHDIIQIAAICLNFDFTPDKLVQPFYMLIKPAHYPYNGLLRAATTAPRATNAEWRQHDHR